MDILSNITRGGQLTLHALRMFRQVFNALLLWSCLLSAGVFGFKSYAAMSSAELTGLADYYLAELMLATGLKKQPLNVVVSGVKYTLSPANCVRLPYFQNIRRNVQLKLMRNAMIAYNVGLVSFALLSIVFIARGLKQSGAQFSRGARLSNFKDVKRAIEVHNKKSCDKKSTAYSLAGMPYPIGSEMEHTLVVGTTGVGKTVLISHLVDQIRARGDKAIIYDKKGDYIRWFYKPEKDFILNPFDTRSQKWNLVKEIESTATIKAIAESFISDKPYGERMWDEAARLAFSGILEKLMVTEPDITNGKLVDLLLRQDLPALADLVKDTHAQGTIDLNSPKTASSVIFILATHFSSLRFTNGSQAESFSIRNWVREAKNDRTDSSILFISSQESLGSELAPLQTAWFEIAISGILSKTDSTTKTWVILDELSTLPRIPSLSRGLSVSRSYGGCFVLGAQNICQLREVYGRNLAESISSECNTRALFKTNDPDTASWISQNIGESETLEYKEGVSYGANNMRDGVNVHSQERLKSVLLASEIQNMPKLNLLIKTSGFGTARTNISYVSRPVINEPFIYDSSVADSMRKIYETPAKAAAAKALPTKTIVPISEADFLMDEKTQPKIF